MLRINRLHGTDGDLANAVTFARAFRNGKWPNGIEPPRVTRWEKGGTIAGYQGIRRYEELLGLPRHFLVAMADSAYRIAADEAGPSHLDRPDVERSRLGNALERALSDDPVNADDWDDLTSDLAGVRELLPVGDARWSRLAERLVLELSIAEDAAWLRRNEAIIRFIGDRHSTPLVIAACASAAADSGNQAPAEPLSILEISPHPDAALHVIRQMAEPASESARRGVWWSAAQKAHRTHLTPPERAAFVRHAGNLLAGYEGHPACWDQAADVLRLLGAITPALLKRFGDDDSTRNILSTGDTVSPALVAPYVRRLADEARSRITAHPGVRGRDEFLDRLLYDVLYSVAIDVKIISLRKIWATPYRIPVADTLVAELDRSSVRGDADLVTAILRALATLGGPVHRRRLEQLALSSGTSPQVRDSAIWHLAHCAGVSSDSVWSTLINRHIADRSGTLAEHTARGVVYCLGVHRRFGDLRTLATSVALPPPIRQAAAWWLNAPTRVLRSTERLPQ